MASDAATQRLTAMQLAGKGDLSGAMAILRQITEAANEPEDRFALGSIAYLLTDFGEAQAQLERVPDQLTRSERGGAGWIALVTADEWETRGRSHLDHGSVSVGRAG